MDSADYIVDTHQHFQDVENSSYPWLDPGRPPPLEGDLTPIRRNYLPSDYRKDMSGLPIAKTVHVQNGRNLGDPVDETRWLSGLAEAQGLPTAIVAYADLASPDVEDILAAHSAFPRLRGIRQILNWHENPNLQTASRPDLMEQDNWRRGFACLARVGLGFDLQIYWPQMRMAFELARDFPATPIILEHFGMPIDRSGAGLESWSSAMRDLALAENVSVKLSGLGLGHPHWSLADTVPVLRQVIGTFGPERVMFGSNLPVDLLFADARKLVAAFDASLKGLGAGDRAKIRHLNAERIYRI